MRTIRRPARFADWEEYEDTYGVDVLLYVNVMRCRACRTEWGIEHNRGKMLQRAHVCPNECNGKLKKARGGQPPMLRRRLEELQDWRGHRDGDEAWEEQDVRHGYYDDVWTEERLAEGRQRRARAQTWLHLRAQPERWEALDRLFEEAAMQPDPMGHVHDECARLRKVDRATADKTDKA